ncbi:hypothetical protein [Corynebacterium epidermidicanis]|uniref:hypothetical protein n=1 Tax=Corynebacterium epidermidicanis TaxID=1050174 RepID=UPI000A6D2C65|nr:hypothetical protein [Corynebacterium epidermidicanis]
MSRDLEGLGRRQAPGVGKRLVSASAWRRQAADLLARRFGVVGLPRGAENGE